MLAIPQIYQYISRMLAKDLFLQAAAAICPFVNGRCHLRLHVVGRKLLKSFAMAENGNGPQPESHKKHSLKTRTGWNAFYQKVALV